MEMRPQGSADGNETQGSADRNKTPNDVLIESRIPMKTRTAMTYLWKHNLQQSADGNKTPKDLLMETRSPKIC